MIVLIYGQREEPTGFETPLVCATVPVMRLASAVRSTASITRGSPLKSDTPLPMNYYYMVKTAGPMALGSLLASCSISQHKRAHTSLRPAPRSTSAQHTSRTPLTSHQGIPSRCLGLLPLSPPAWRPLVAIASLQHA